MFAPNLTIPLEVDGAAAVVIILFQFKKGYPISKFLEL
jgi:hypothetical protein